MYRVTDRPIDRSTGTAPYPAATVLDAALDAADHVASPVDAVASVTHELAAALGAVRVSFLIADMSGRALVRLAHVAAADFPRGGAAPDVRHPTAAGVPDDRQDDREHAAVLPFDGGPQEQVVRAQVPRVLPPGTGPAASPAGWTVLAPVTERGEALGLLEMVLPDEPDAGTVAEIGRAARVLAFVVIADRRHTDLFEWGQRTRPFTLSAEIQRRLLPAAYTCESGSFTLAAWLEPAASVGGDTFDYSLARDVLHLSMTDAMGHGVGSALTATLCVSALRTVRRTGSTADRAGGERQRRAGGPRGRGVQRGVRDRPRRAAGPGHRCARPARTPGTCRRSSPAGTTSPSSTCPPGCRSGSSPGRRTPPRGCSCTPATGSCS